MTTEEQTEQFINLGDVCANYTTKQYDKINIYGVVIFKQSKRKYGFKIFFSFLLII